MGVHTVTSCGVFDTALFRMQYIFAPFDRKSSAETIRGAAGIKVLRKTIKYTIPQE
jgi:hypothetical protein